MKAGAYHLDRMSHYARLIAQGLALQQSISDEFVEFLCRFAPVHDIGKIASPTPSCSTPKRLLRHM